MVAFAALILVAALTTACGDRSFFEVQDETVLIELQQVLAKAWIAGDRATTERIIAPEWTSTGESVNAPECPQCRVQMDRGFVPDLGHHSWPNEPKWTAGTPERSFWRGIILKGKMRLSITTYRCPRCGLLQSYAGAT